MSLHEGISQEMMELIFEISSEAVWVRNLDTGEDLWFSSPECKHRYGIPPGNATTDFWITNIHPEDRAIAMQGFQGAFDNPDVKVFEHEYRFLGAARVLYYIRDRMKFTRDASGKVIRVMGVWQDVSRERQRQQALEATVKIIDAERNRFKLISEISNAAMWEADFATGKISWFGSSKALSEFGLDTVFYSLYDREQSIHEEDRPNAIRAFSDAISSGADKYFDTYRVRKVDGTYASLIDSATILRDSTGKPTKALGSWLDITRERDREEVLERALIYQRNLNHKLELREEELRQLNAQLSENIKALSEREFILNQSQSLAKIGSWEFDLETKKTFWSDEMYNIYGVNEAFPISDIDETAKLYEPRSAYLVREVFKDIMNRRNLAFDITTQVITPLGYKKWLRTTAYPVQNDDAPKRVVGITYDITFFKEAEERLKTSEEKFAKAFRNSPDLMVITREDDLLIIDVNDKVYSVLGYTRDEVVGKNSTDFSFFVDQQDRVKFFSQYTAQGQAVIECPWWSKAGKQVQLLIASSRVELDGRKYFISVIRDISDRKAAEEKFIKAFELSPDLILILREGDLSLVEVNDKLESLSGYTREEVMGKSSVDFNLWANPADRNFYFEELRRSGYVSMEAVILRKDKTTLYGNISAKHIVLSNEKHILVVVRDITESKLAAEKLQQNETNLNAIINNSDMSIWSVDTDFRLIALNNNFRDYMFQWYGVAFEVGKNIFEVAQGKVPERMIDYWRQLFQRAFTGELILTEDHLNEDYLQYSVNPIIENRKVVGAAIYSRNITERVQRERELAEANKKIGELRLMALRSVMNPHFIFNALNSIQYFIAKNDRQNAISYLSTFSKLIRGILTNSVNDKISLADELDLLKHYINLEKVRFENKFDVQIDVDPELDVENIEVPSLLIQPYVENAILHGLNTKADKGHLRLAVRYDGDRVLVEVEDDGIGREAARKLREQNFPKHRSIGTVLTEERLNLINERENVSLEIEDRVDSEGKPAGTRIKIWMRF